MGDSKSISIKYFVYERKLERILFKLNEDNFFLSLVLFLEVTLSLDDKYALYSLITCLVTLLNSVGEERPVSKKFLNVSRSLS